MSLPSNSHSELAKAAGVVQEQLRQNTLEKQAKLDRAIEDAIKARDDLREAEGAEAAHLAEKEQLDELARIESETEPTKRGRRPLEQSDDPDRRRRGLLVRDLLLRHPKWPDREIARRAGASASVVKRQREGLLVNSRVNSP
jgi:hypothetical protein